MRAWPRLIKKLIDLLFWPFALPVDWAYRFRRFAYNYNIFKAHEFHVPIISVGNISFGGTGKTPLVIWISEYLASLEKKVMILTRGYRGKLEHSRGIIRSGIKLGINPVDFGDEALLLARRLKHASLVVGKNRVRNLETYFSSELPDVVLLDDGFQHLRLKRQLNIVLFDARMDLARYKVAPRGYLRESLSALRDADVVMISRCNQVNEKQKQNLKQLLAPYLSEYVVVAETYYHTMGVFDANYRLAFKTEDLKGKRVVLAAGIASPQSFFKTVESLGAIIVQTAVFPDHHYYNLAEIQSLMATATALDAVLLVTEKDIVKMRRYADPESLFFLEIEVAFARGEEEFKAKIRQVCGMHRPPVAQD